MKRRCEISRCGAVKSLVNGFEEGISSRGFSFCLLPEYGDTFFGCLMAGFQEIRLFSAGA